MSVVQDYTQLDKFKDALKQAAQTVTTLKVVFADASANSGASRYSHLTLHTAWLHM